MLDKLKELETRYEKLSNDIIDPEVISDIKKWQKLVKEHSVLEEIVEKYREFKKVKEQIEDAREMQKEKLDEEMKQMVKMELDELIEIEERLDEEIKILLIPKDPNDEKNVLLEIRAGTGGDEASLFAGNLFRMYSRYAERQGWKYEIMSSSEQQGGGYKEIVALIKGEGAYSKLKYESGVHRVQRVPETESSGRIHTSTATVAVLPEADDVDIDISQSDIRVDVYRSSGNGGQSVNTTDSAVRITHIPTGLVVACQDEKSQLKNKDKAMQILKTRLYDKMMEEQNAEIAEERKSQVGSGDRSAKIRTYNFPQGRITDHRINLTVYKLESFLDGEIEEMVEGLITSHQAENLKKSN